MLALNRLETRAGKYRIRQNMLDAQLRKIIDPPLNIVGRQFARMGISANTVTVTGFVVGMGAVPAIASQNYVLALICIGVNRISDGLDGAVARHSVVTDLGGYLDIVFDFIFYSAVVFGFALAEPQNAVAAAFLIFSFIGTGSSFLAFAVMAEKHDMKTDFQGKKSLYYLGGLTEGGETILVLILFCLMPQYFVLIATIFGILCWITTSTRIYAAWLALRPIR
jgi:phosphatidylglycerophosphate synthase